MLKNYLEVLYDFFPTEKNPRLKEFLSGLLSYVRKRFVALKSDR